MHSTLRTHLCKGRRWPACRVETCSLLESTIHIKGRWTRRTVIFHFIVHS